MVDRQVECTFGNDLHLLSQAVLSHGIPIIKCQPCLESSEVVFASNVQSQPPTCLSIMAIQPISNGDQAGPSTSLYRPTHTLQAHSRAVTALRYSGDGRTLVSGGADGWVHFWYIPHAGRYRQTADSVGTVFPTNISEASKHIHKVSRSWRREFASRNADCIRY